MLSKVFKSSWQKDVAKATSRAATVYKPPKGFRVSGTIVGVKPNNTTKLDLAFITSKTPCSAAAVVTKTKFQAAPITVSRKLLESHGSNIRGVIINSGNANAVTGSGGLEDAVAMSKAADQYLGAENSSLVMSTGVIGQRLPIKRILDGIPAAHEGLGDSEMHWMECATAIWRWHDMSQHGHITRRRRHRCTDSYPSIASSPPRCDRQVIQQHQHRQ
ncbi:hypothetical protein NPX13_g6252 [Xylaria arbuscula]|uniref:Uncharacterized protein n=1 Tax=Xylaria arbuscula TaxID=114810 RepID=A0A9W8NCV7_9PEZI|nr:hypothetical protein NPX13_g6252 [Xylaria arbuscula]